MSLKERIVEQSSNMFVTEGIKAIRMDDIAAKVGISKRTLYEQFKDKEALIIACMNFFQQQHNERQRQISLSSKNVIESFIMMLGEWDKTADASYQIISSVRKFYPKIYEKMIADGYRKDHEKLKLTLGLGIEQGLFLDNIDIDLAISVFTYSLYGLISRDDVIRPRNVSHQAAFKYIITYFFRGIATEKGIKLLDEYLSKTNI